MKRIRRQRPFLETVLREGSRHTRQALLQHANSDQINAISELTLNLLKRHIPITPATLAKLKRHKVALRNIARRKHSIKRRREELVKQKGAGFWKGLDDSQLQTMIELRRHSDGSPMDSVDVVPDGGGDRTSSVRLREQLASVMSLLQAANDRNANLLSSVSRWKRDYANVRDELLALKYRRLCAACQLQRLFLRDGECLEVTCNKCDTDQTNLTKLRDEADDKARYWQRCYESLLAVHYGEGNDDGTDLGLQ